ncbi:hypothetical protein FD04_GL002241 [Secundilactobacillus odoratitofui DSM 19909 = JCM 15043]|uniref:DUF1694 domain-containing protein n=1 Tax=Secundilactobacillus odoratitofui DSM 19909 = JCM 15043 TaxID=1423776 RepID=A0A0R1LVH1_9LACO|nr:YueI family protein [Secundilactobacillus odoratitofui]KRK99424.1 hypothetical protein FD04_GL002241 [Secundilactobacillus odoratitofui DSM 19909 = JCM 15043]
MPDSDPLSTHLDNAMYGPPKLHPDEQRKYLGTFRERVSLLITIEQLQHAQYQEAFKTELTEHPDLQAIFNGHTGMSALKPYLTIAGQLQRAFTIVQDDFYGDTPTSSGLVVIAKTAINVYPIAVEKKYPPKSTQNTSTATANSNTGFWQNIKHHLGL